jgi:hypothetical protein
MWHRFALLNKEARLAHLIGQQIKKANSYESLQSTKDPVSLRSI